MRRLGFVLILSLLTTIALAQKQSTGEASRSASPSSNQAASAPSMPSSPAPSSGGFSGGNSSAGHSSAPSSTGNSGGMSGHASMGDRSGNPGNSGQPSRANSTGGAARSGGAANAHSNARSNHAAESGRSTNAPADLSHSKLPADPDASANNGRDPRAKTDASSENAAHHSRWMFWKHDHPRSGQPSELTKGGKPDLQRPPCKGENCKPPCPAGQSVGENGACGPAKPQPTNTITCPNGATVSNANECVTVNANSKRDCSVGQAQLNAEELELERLRDRVRQACALGQTSPACIEAQRELATAEAKVDMMRRQNALCSRLNQ